MGPKRHGCLTIGIPDTKEEKSHGTALQLRQMLLMWPSAESCPMFPGAGRMIGVCCRSAGSHKLRSSAASRDARGIRGTCLFLRSGASTYSPAS